MTARVSERQLQVTSSSSSYRSSLPPSLHNFFPPSLVFSSEDLFVCFVLFFLPLNSSSSSSSSTVSSYASFSSFYYSLSLTPSLPSAPSPPFFFYFNLPHISSSTVSSSSSIISFTFYSSSSPPPLPPSIFQCSSFQPVSASLPTILFSLQEGFRITDCRAAKHFFFFFLFFTSLRTPL